jgi:non-specific serine/threonine protein kinase/serine/threonine-protein kinase
MSAAEPDLEAVFSEALTRQSPVERAAYLDRICAGDSRLRQRVERLLAALPDMGSFLGTPAVEAVATAFQPLTESAGTQIGPYKLLQQIGEGGMGVVFMAQQTSPVERKVALKIIKPGMDSRQVIARFEAERQALALMDHPNIAKVFDAGTTGTVGQALPDSPLSSLSPEPCPLPPGTGRPYFVMELVKGVPITQHCDEKHLTLKERLELFVPVCQAIQHAHQKGIIHRDLKPSNVLVAEYDEKPVAKIIDFGVAKAVGQRLTEKTMFTEFGQMVGTIDYMSPEQAKLNQLDIDTRSDIYSLGVLLYELLTGETPFDRKRLQSAAFDEMLRIIREEEPPKPSTRLSALSSPGHSQRGLAPREEPSGSGTRSVPTTLAAIAANRNSEPARLPDLLRGELDWIVMKCLEKERARRYETANGLARDLEHYLADEPVQACPPSASYRFRKFARRNKRSLLAAALVLLALVGGIVATTWQAVRATRANTLALRRLAQVEKSNEILGSIFLDIDPREEEQGRPLRAQLAERLDQAASQLDSEAIGDPLALARLQDTLGASQTVLGHMRKGLPLMEKALKARETLLGPDHEDTLKSMHNVAFALQLSGQREKALAIFEQVWPKRKEKLGADHVDTLNSAQLLARGYLVAGRRDEALAITEQIRSAAKNKLDPSHRLRLFNAQMLAEMYTKTGRFDEALTLLKETLARQKATFGADHFATLFTLNGIAGTYYAAGRIEKALPLWEETLTKAKQKLGPDNPTTAVFAYNLAVAYRATGQFEKAVALFEDALVRQRTTLGPDHPTTLDTIDRLALAYRNAGDYTRAENTFLEALARKRRTLAADDPSLTHTMASLGGNYLKQKRYAEAESLLRECLAIRAKKESHKWEYFATQRGLGESLLGQKRYAEAEKHLVEGYQGLKSREQIIPPFDRRAITEGLEQFVELYEAWEKPDEAARWRTELMNRKPNDSHQLLRETTKRTGTNEKNDR